MNLSFSRRTDLALAALDVLSRSPDGKRNRSQLARATGTTPSFLAQVMGPIVKAGWVTSERGPGGGYRISPDAGEVRLLDLVELYEGPTLDGRCVLKDGPCPGSGCLVHEVWTEARRVLVAGFEEAPIVHMQGQGERT